MIFLVVGVFLTILGCLFLFIPSKGNLPFMVTTHRVPQNPMFTGG